MGVGEARVTDDLVTAAAVVGDGDLVVLGERELGGGGGEGDREVERRLEVDRSLGDLVDPRTRQGWLQAIVDVKRRDVETLCFFGALSQIGVLGGPAAG